MLDDVCTFQAGQSRTPSPGQLQNPQDPSRNLKLPAEDLAIIKDRVFGLDNFYVRPQQICSTQLAVIDQDEPKPLPLSLH